MPIITIRGLLGSGAPEIGRQIAERLHLDYVDRQIIAAVAMRLQRQQQDVMDKEMPTGNVFGRIAESLGRTYGFEAMALPTWEIPLDDTQYLRTLESVIRELAASQSIVIFGRGSQFILKDYPSALHVLVVAPMELRVKRVMQNLKSDVETAKREIMLFDNGGREFIKRYFHAQAEDPEHFDMVIDTDHLNYDAAASIIIHALSFKDQTIGRQTKTD